MKTINKETKAIEIYYHNEEIKDYCKEGLDVLMRHMCELSGLPTDCWCIGGSAALWFYGINIGRKIGDIDVIVTKKAFKMLYDKFIPFLAILTKIDKNCGTYYPNPTITFSVPFCSVPINIIGEDHYECLELGNTRICTLNCILGHKRRMNRHKDKNDIMIIKHIMYNLESNI